MLKVLSSPAAMAVRSAAVGIASGYLASFCHVDITGASAIGLSLADAQFRYLLLKHEQAGAPTPAVPHRKCPPATAAGDGDGAAQHEPRSLPVAADLALPAPADLSLLAPGESLVITHTYTVRYTRSHKVG